MRALTLLTTAAVLAVSGCERTPGALMSAPGPVPYRLARPDTDYRLTPEERARVPRGYDVNALERLLGMIDPGERPEMLAAFQYNPEQAESGEWEAVVRINDPVLQAVLEEVWAPYWDHYTDEQIDREVGWLPGREVAKRRRAALRDVKQGGKAH